MKLIYQLTCATAFIFITQIGKAQVATADSMVHKLFASLKKKDEKAFVMLHPNAEQYAGNMHHMMKQVLSSPAMQQVMAVNPDAKNMNMDSLIDVEINKMNNFESFAEAQEKYVTRFRNFLAAGEKKGVNWSDAELTTYTMDTTDAPWALGPDDTKSLGVKDVRGVVDFTSAGTAYQLDFFEAIYIPVESDWFGGDFGEVIKKGEKFAQDSFEKPDNFEKEDVMIGGVQDKNRSPAKLKTKTTAGKTTTKRKTKTKS